MKIAMTVLALSYLTNFSYANDQTCAEKEAKSDSMINKDLQAMRSQLERVKLIKSINENEFKALSQEDKMFWGMTEKALSTFKVARSTEQADKILKRLIEEMAIYQDRELCSNGVRMTVDQVIHTEEFLYTKADDKKLDLINEYLYLIVNKSENKNGLSLIQIKRLEKLKSILSNNVSIVELDGQAYKSKKESAWENVKTLFDTKLVNFDHQVDSLSYCSSIKNDAGWSTLYQIDCKANLMANFKNNEWSFDLKDWDRKDEIKKCVEDNLKMGVEIERIVIKSSSNSLNNTGEAELQFGKKGFNKLSQQRAEFVRDNVLDFIIPNTVENKTQIIAQAAIDSNGLNGDGTSGECPYKIVDGKEVLKEKFLDTANLQELEKSKRVNVYVRFRKTVQDSKEDKFYSRVHKVECERLKFQCRN